MATDRAINPYLFVVGCPRSGTTLLQRMLDAHPSLAVANDTHFIPRCLEQLVPQQLDEAAAGRSPVLTPQLVRAVREYHRFPRLGLDRAVVDDAARGAATYGAFVSRLYDRFACARGKPLGAEKTPDYVRHLDLLHGLFPEARFVHIVRDGRDVALSALEWAQERKGPGRLGLWQDDPLATCALWWRTMVDSGREAGLRLGPRRYLEVRYEALVAEPRRELSHVAAFLDLPFDEAMVRFNRGRELPNERLSAKSRWMPPTPGLRDWRSQMSPDDVALFEELAGDLLDMLGLCRGDRAGPGRAGGRAARALDWWRDWSESRRVKTLRRAGKPC